MYIHAILINKMTMPSSYFPSETTTVATGDQEIENKAGQYGKNSNFLIIHSTNISLILYMC